MDSDRIMSLGRWSQESINRLLADVGPVAPGRRIGLISEAFLGTPYKEATLIGDPEAKECLVMNLAEVDCFTFIDYIEALRRSVSFDEFQHNLMEVRYRSGVLSYGTRNHFFTDWIDRNGSHIADITGEIGPDDVRTIKKLLNKRDDGTAFVEGIPPTERDITYLPVNALFAKLDRLRTGDYLGIYSAFDGLDVSHTGIVVEIQGGLVLRHASSQEGTRKVIDQDLSNYLNNKPGIIILRPR